MDTVLRKLFDSLMLKMSHTINQERREYLPDRKERQYTAFFDNLSKMRHLKREEARDVFQRLIRLISGDVARYMRRRLISPYG